MTDDEPSLLTDDYRDELRRLSERHPSVTDRTIERRFVEAAREVRRRLKDGAPCSLVRRLALIRVESRLSESDQASD